LLATYIGSSFDSFTTVAVSPYLIGHNYFIATAGTTYQIAVDGAYGGNGDFALSLVLTPPPPNDDFANRIPIASFPATIKSSNIYATSEPDEPVHVDSGGLHSVWYSWTALFSGVVTFEVRAGSVLNVGIYTGSSLASLAVVTNRTWSATIHAVTGTTYQIAVDGDYSQFTLRLIPPPPNDDFSNRIALRGTNVWRMASNAGATLEPGEPAGAAPSFAGHTVWWTWTAPYSGTVNLNMGPFQHILGSYTGSSVDNLRPIAQSVSYDGPLDFFALQGTTYQIQVGGFGGANGDFIFLLTPRTPETPPGINGAGASLADGGFKIPVIGRTGQRFKIEATGDFIHWTDLGTNTLAADSGEFFDEQARNFSHRFYRLSPLPSVK
jgi:hypothetical protein